MTDFFSTLIHKVNLSDIGHKLKYRTFLYIANIYFAFSIENFLINVCNRKHS